MDLAQRPTAEEVGDAFAEQYYLVLKKHPNLLHKFYKHDSHISRLGLDGIMRYSTFSGLDGNDLNMLSSGGFESVEVTSVISQDSLHGCVFVTVDGYFNSKERRRARNFIQFFILAPQENGNYFAYNDLFRLIDISKAPANNVPETVEVADDSPRVSEDVPKISDSSVVTKAIAIAIGQGQHASSSDLSPDQSQASGTECSVFVKRLPPHVTKDMIENAFNKFGRVKSGGIEIRHPDFEYYYAFVEFEEADAAKRAIKASHVLVGGRKVLVKKKLNTVKSYEEQMRIQEEEERQCNQNRYGSKQVRGTGAFNFWEWKKKIDEQRKTHEEAMKL